MVRWEGKASLKNPVKPPGIDPGTLGLVAQRLNHYATPRPIVVCSWYIFQIILNIIASGQCLDCGTFASSELYIADLRTTAY